jgi:uncharacterized protein DUF4232
MTLSTNRWTRTALLAGAAAIGIGALSAAAVPAASAGGTTPGCTTADLGARLLAGSPGAGQRYATVVLTDTGGRTCSVTGYGGLALLGAPGQGVPTDLQRVGSPAPRTVTLSPGGSARSLLHWTVVPAGDETGAACQPAATTAVVTPPDGRTAALVPWSSGPVCQHGAIQQNAYVPGSAAF